MLRRENKLKSVGHSLQVGARFLGRMRGVIVQCHLNLDGVHVLCVQLLEIAHKLPFKASSFVASIPSIDIRCSEGRMLKSTVT